MSVFVFKLGWIHRRFNMPSQDNAACAVDDGPDDHVLHQFHVVNFAFAAGLPCDIGNRIQVKVNVLVH
jgi:hypothetical protein